MYVYIEGDVDEKQLDEACAAMDNAFYDADFIGCGIEEVRERPKDQGGT